MYFIWMIVKFIGLIPYRLIYWTRIINKREYKKHRGKPVVFVCNHKSFADPPLMFMRFHRRLNFPVKEELMRKKIPNFFFRTIGCFPVKRGNDLALMRHCLGKLKKGQAVFIFPEGRRVFNSNESLAVRDGAAMIAIKGGAPIVPMVLKRAPRPFVPNAIKIGATISTEQYQNKRMEKADLSELSGKIQAAMSALLDGFEHKPRPKWWEAEQSVISRGIVIHENRLLVIKRVKEGQEYYVLPGGHIDDGENVRDAAAREVREETSIKCETVRLLYKYKREGDPNPRANGMQSFYLCAYKSGEPNVTDAEEYTDTTRVSGSYEPMYLDLEKLDTADLRPACIKKQLVCDIGKYGVHLTRNTKYVK